MNLNQPLCVCNMIFFLLSCHQLELFDYFGSENMKWFSKMCLQIVY